MRREPGFASAERPGECPRTLDPFAGADRMPVEAHEVVHPLEDAREAIATLCERHAVARMYVFGSASRDDFRPGESDIDLLVEFAPLEPYEKAKAYFALLDGLKELLGINVDLVSAGAIRNRYIAREVDRTKQMLYAA
jgi:uncharacterized protein